MTRHFCFLPFSCSVPERGLREDSVLVPSALERAFHHCLAGQRTWKRCRSGWSLTFVWEYVIGGSREMVSLSLFHEKKKNGIVAQEVGNEDRWEIASMRDGDLKQGWSFACYGKIRPLCSQSVCSQSVCRTWQSRVWHSLWRESGEESIRINGFISQSKSREGKMKITPLSALFCPIIQLSICFSSSFRFVTYCL